MGSRAGLARQRRTTSWVRHARRLRIGRDRCGHSACRSLTHRIWQSRRRRRRIRRRSARSGRQRSGPGRATRIRNPWSRAARVPAAGIGDSDRPRAGPAERLLHGRVAGRRHLRRWRRWGIGNGWWRRRRQRRRSQRRRNAWILDAVWRGGRRSAALRLPDARRRLDDRTFAARGRGDRRCRRRGRRPSWRGGGRWRRRGSPWRLRSRRRRRRRARHCGSSGWRRSGHDMGLRSRWRSRTRCGGGRSGRWRGGTRRCGGGRRRYRAWRRGGGRRRRRGRTRRRSRGWRRRRRSRPWRLRSRRLRRRGRTRRGRRSRVALRGLVLRVGSCLSQPQRRTAMAIRRQHLREKDHLIAEHETRDQRRREQGRFVENLHV